MSEKLERFIKLLKTIFEIDKSDLNFGIYRILNLRRAQISDFLENILQKDVKAVLLSAVSDDDDAIKKELTKIEMQCRELGTDATATLKYKELQSRLNSPTSMAELETDVYSALYNFFNRYYDEGDFISKRRYKEGVYAIPYEGEEVKLYWANHDQYYIKSSENFKDYSFKVEDKTIHFKIVDATTEQDNKKESSGTKRVFMLADGDFIEETDSELTIKFIYDLSETKQDKIELYKTTHNKVIKDFKQWDKYFNLVDNEDNKLLIEKHFKRYVAKNSFDYFIHKDLRGFLSRELDFFIKSEVMHLDDLDTDNEASVSAYLAKVRAIKRVGRLIIDFLAQIEEFQKKLWLKKKFIVETNWCITLDRVDKSFYKEIIANTAQIKEWCDMYAIDEITGDLHTKAFSNPLTVEFLEENQNLVLDTKHFSASFKENLLESIDNLDEQTDGVMIHSENFQALNLLQERYKEQVKCVYIDPPYNAKSSEIMYKNSYKHSSWISLMDNRLCVLKQFQKNDFVLIVAIDEVEQEVLGQLLSTNYSQYEKECIVVNHNPSGQQGDNFSFTHEYAYFIYPSGGRYIGEKFRENPNDWDERNFRDVTGNESLRFAGANCFYPIYIKDQNIIGFGSVCPDEFHPKTNEQLENNIIAIYPIDPEGIERKWRFARHTVESIKDELKVHYLSKRDIYDIKRLKKKFNYKSNWIDACYSANNHGTQLLNQIIPNISTLYPKSLFTVKDSLVAGLNGNKSGIILDYFAGSGTTAHAVINLNREDGGKRKYILVEMGEYFNTVTLPRVKKVVYSADWKNGKPTNRESGVSHIMKYFTMESYEDTLQNIELDNNKHNIFKQLGDDYLLNYMLDNEMCLLDINTFKNPFDYKLKITEKNESIERKIDMIETFNYLIGLNVIKQCKIARRTAAPDPKGEYEGAVKLEPAENGEHAFKCIEGTLRNGQKILIIWRNLTDDRLRDNAALDEFFRKKYEKPSTREFDIIYINGDNTLENLRIDGETWMINLIETEFKKRMFEER